MSPDGKIKITGFVTQYRYLGGRTLQYIERALGFHPGRLRMGAKIATLDRLPTLDEFETAGYSQVAGHRHVAPTDLDMNGLKRMAMSAWAPIGPNRLVKVLATLPHNISMRDDVQYPPGLGIPQWKLIRPGVPGNVVYSLNQYSDVFNLS